MSEERRGRVVRVNGPDDEQWSFQDEWRPRRGGFPAFGVFLILLGLFLILNTYVPVANIAGSVFFLVIGLVLLASWARDRGHVALHLGAIITAFALSDLLTGLGIIHGEGWGTLFVGVALLAVAGIRLAGGGGWGWQVVGGIVLAVIGGSEVAASYGSPDINRLAIPLLIVLLGLWVMTRERSVPRR